MIRPGEAPFIRKAERDEPCWRCYDNARRENKSGSAVLCDAAVVLDGHTSCNYCGNEIPLCEEHFAVFLLELAAFIEEREKQSPVWANALKRPQQGSAIEEFKNDPNGVEISIPIRLRLHEPARGDCGDELEGPGEQVEVKKITMTFERRDRSDEEWREFFDALLIDVVKKPGGLVECNDDRIIASWYSCPGFEEVDHE